MEAPVTISAPPRRRPQQRLRAAEFFAGIGLVRLALERQKWGVCFANDIDPAKRVMYADNFNDAHFHLGDIHDLSSRDIPYAELWTASFPCNDLSIAGRQTGLDGDHSSAFWGLIRLLEDAGERRPPLVMLENVYGFLQAHGGSDFLTAMRALNALGYAVDVLALNARHWTPQSRQRLFVVGKQTPAAPPGELQLTDARPQAIIEAILSNPDIAWSIQPVPPLPRCRQRIAHIIEDLPADDAHWWSRERAEYFMNQLSERHLADARRMMAGDETTYATAFRRVRKGRSMAELRTDGIAGCLRTPRGGSGRQILFAAGNGEYRVRLLTARECARLQGVDDSYRINVSLNQALFGFGDAICVPAVEWIVKHYLTPAARELCVEPSLFEEAEI